MDSTDLIRQQAHLRVRSEQLRRQLQIEFNQFKKPIAQAEQLRKGLSWLQSHPLWPTLGLAWVVLKRPRRLLRWSGTALTFWKGYRLVRSWINSK